MIEITFEDVKLKTLVELLIKIISSSNLIDYQIQADKSAISIDFRKSVEVLNVLNDISAGAIVLNFKTFRMNNWELDDLSLRILKYNGGLFDLNILCNYGSIFSKYSPEFIQKWAIDYARTLEAETFYCGYEPSSDEDTRFFSENILGPLK